MDFSARKQTLEMRRLELAGALAGAGLALDKARLGAARQQRSARSGTRVFSPSPEAGLEELHRIDAALARLREGSYGFCQICGDDIGGDWLDQRPASPFCKSCAM